MKKPYFLGGMVLLVCLLLTPATSQAYETTNQAAYQLDEHTYLFTISYTFGYLNAVAKLPVAATREPSRSATEPHLTYALETMDGAAISGGDTYAVVLSDATVADDVYHIGETERTEFTLLVLYRDTRNENHLDEVALQITELTNVVEKRDGEQRLIALDTKELAPYRAVVKSSAH